jgi:hypothetical protein
MPKPPKSPWTPHSLVFTPQDISRLTSGAEEDDDRLHASDQEVQRQLMAAESIPDPDADQGDCHGPAQASKEALAKIAENAPPILLDESPTNPKPGKLPSTAPIGDDQDGLEDEPKIPKRGGLPPENDPPAA